MKKILYRIASRFPSRGGAESLDDLIRFLSTHGINFRIEEIHDESGAYFIAESTNAPNKAIITSGKTVEELDKNIKDAIFTIFDVPSYYCDERVIRTTLPKKSVELVYASK
ncbi:MAG: hypothetical protein QMD77_00040 [Patescibacteria group bacterium]|nr:hypothetical protein [Patescibacteria group bacterium]